MPEHFGAGGKHAIISSRNHKRHIAGVKGLVGNDHGPTGAVAHRDVSRRKIRIQRSFHPMNSRFQKGRIHYASYACDITFPQGRQHTDHAKKSSRLVINRCPAEVRLFTRPAGHTHHAAISLHQWIKGRAIAHRAGLSKGGNIAINQSRMPRTHDLSADSASLHNAQTEILDQNISRLAKAVQGFNILRSLNIQDDTALVSVLAVEIQTRLAIRPKRRSPEARIIAAVWFFHLDHIGAHIGHDSCRERCGQSLTHLNDSYAFQW